MPTPASILMNTVYSQGHHGSSNSFDPLAIDGLKLWLDPSDNDSVDIDGSNGINQVDDKSGNALHLIHNAGLSVAKALLDSDNAIQFEGSNSWNICGGNGGTGDSDEFNYLHNGTGGTVLLVVKIDSTNIGSFATLFSTGQYVSSGQSGVAAWYRDDGAYNSQLATNIVAPSGAPSQAVHGDYGLRLGEYVILAIKMGGTVDGSNNDMQVLMNNIFHAGVDKSGTAYSTGDSNWGFLLGSTGSGTVGEIHFKEVLVYEGYLADSDLLLLHNYLNEKHSVYNSNIGLNLQLGQSNCTGLAQIINATQFAAYDSVPRTLIYDAKSESGWAQLRANYTNAGLGSSQFGAEMTFAIDTIEDTLEEIGIIKYGEGSTTLAIDWANGGEIYEDAIAKINSAIFDLERNLGRTCYIKSVLFAQGESDAQGLSFSSAYQANLISFISRIREDVKGTNHATKFILPEIYTDDGATWPYVDEINTAKANVAGLDSTVEIIENTGFSTIASDDIHLDASTQETIGSSWSDASGY